MAPNCASGSLKMITFVKDCLGSVRSVVDLSDGTVLEQNDYYAFGERVNDSTQTMTSLNRWRFNAKEEQASIACLPYLDYGARLYDPVIGRWMQQDPMATKYPHLSPYNFCGDNPVNYVDPDGRKIVTRHFDKENQLVTEYTWHTDEGGYFYDEASGCRYSVGTDSYIDNLTSALQKLMSKKNGAAIVHEVSDEEHSILITRATLNRFHESEGQIGWSDIPIPSRPIPTIKGIEDNIPFVSLGHELAHAMDYLRGTLSNEEWFRIEYDNESPPDIIYYSDIFSTHHENLIRAEHGLPLRRSYVDGWGRILDAKHNSLYYNVSGSTNYRRVKKGYRYVYD